jgi:hypothetical protein
MKRIYLWFILLLFTDVCKAQELYSIVDTTKIWSILYQTYGLGKETGTTRSYLMKGEEYFNNKLYKKMYVCNDSLLKVWYSTDTLIRESSKKVYLKLPKDSLEILMYDFNLKVGDTIRIGNKWSVLFYVLDIDSVMVDGFYKRKFYLNDWSGHSPEYWIETIGSLYDFFNPGYWQSVAPRLLLCIRDIKTHNIIYVHIPSWGCYKNFCRDNGIDCTVQVESDILINNKIQIFPNPIKDILYIKTTWNFYQLTISDILGVIIKQGIYSEDISIDCNFLKPGIYLIKVKTEKEEVINKIIKTK